MMHNSFEKEIADKLNAHEIQPSEGLLETIFEKRASRARHFAYPGMVLASVAFVALSVTSIWMWNNDGIGNTSKGESNIVKSEISPVENNNSPGSSRIEQGSNSGEMNKTPIVSESIAAERSSSVKPHSSKPRSSKPITTSSVQPEAKREITKPTGNVEPDSRDIDQRYFNIQSRNRPVIAKSEHKGNSHMYIYQTVSEKELAESDIQYSHFKRLAGMPFDLKFEDGTFISYIKTEERPVHHRKPMFIDLLGSPIMSSVGIYGNELLKSAGNGLNKSSLNTQFGVRLIKPVSDRISVFTGVNYLMQTNVYKGEIYYEKDEVRIDKNISYINDPVTGNVIQIVSFDTVNFRAENTQKIDHKNIYKLWQVPIGWSYNFGFRNFDFSINTSALLNAFRNSNGNAINMETHNTHSFSSSKTYFGMGAGLSFTSACKISPKLRFIVEPGLQYFRINSMKAGNSANEKILNSQLTLGLRYTLF